MMNDTPRAFVGCATFTVAGMKSPECERALIAEVRRVAGVLEVLADAATGTVSVAVDRPVDRSEIAAAFARAGHPLTV